MFEEWGCLGRPQVPAKVLSSWSNQSCNGKPGPNGISGDSQTIALMRAEISPRHFQIVLHYIVQKLSLGPFDPFRILARYDLKCEFPIDKCSVSFAFSGSFLCGILLVLWQAFPVFLWAFFWSSGRISHMVCSHIPRHRLIAHVQLSLSGIQPMPPLFLCPNDCSNYNYRRCRNVWMLPGF